LSTANPPSPGAISDDDTPVETLEPSSANVWKSRRRTPSGIATNSESFANHRFAPCVEFRRVSAREIKQLRLRIVSRSRAGFDGVGKPPRRISWSSTHNSFCPASASRTIAGGRMPAGWLSGLNGDCAAGMKTAVPGPVLHRRLRDQQVTRCTGSTNRQTNQFSYFSTTSPHAIERCSVAQRKSAARFCRRRERGFAEHPRFTNAPHSHCRARSRCDRGPFLGQRQRRPVPAAH